MSERFTPYEPPESKEPARQQPDFSPETKSRIQQGPEAKPDPLNPPMEGGGQWYAYSDGQGGLVTPEMLEKHRSPENQAEREPYTYRAVSQDPAATPPPTDDSATPPTNDSTTPPADDSTTPPAAPPDNKKPLPDPGSPPGSPPPPPPPNEDQTMLEWMKRERERQEHELQEDIDKFNNRPKPPWYRGPDDPPLNPPPLDHRPLDQINDVDRPMTETTEPLKPGSAGRRSMRGSDSP